MYSAPLSTIFTPFFHCLFVHLPSPLPSLTTPPTPLSPISIPSIPLPFIPCPVLYLPTHFSTPHHLFSILSPIPSTYCASFSFILLPISLLLPFPSLPSS